MSVTNTISEARAASTVCPVSEQSPPAAAKRPLRLLFVIATLGPGGAERQLVTLARALRLRGHEIEFFTYHEVNFYRHLLDDVGITVHCHPKRSKFSFTMLRELRRLMKGGSFDVVLSFLPAPNLWTVLAATGLKAHPKIVVSERTCFDTSAISKLDYTVAHLVNQTYRRADWIAVNSYHLSEQFSENYDWAKGKISCIWNGVDLERFHFSPPPSPVQPLQLLGIGRIAPYKKWDCLVEALAILRDRHGVLPIVRHIGVADKRVPYEANHEVHLRERIQSLGLNSQWEWLGECADVPEQLGRHHALVHPSIIEGLPNTVCEALACGRPVLVSNVLDHPRLVRHGETGFLFDPENPNSLADVILQLHNLSADERATMAIAGRAFAEQQFSIDRFADQYEALFENVLAPTKPGG